jgi:hypothetical protein
MALIRCVHCKAEIARNANPCPKCGGKYPATPPIARLIAGGVAVCVVGAIGISAFFKTEERRAGVEVGHPPPSAADVDAAFRSSAKTAARAVLFAKFGKVETKRPPEIVEMSPPFAMVSEDVGSNDGAVCIIVQVRDPASDKFYADTVHGTLSCSSTAADMLKFKAVNGWPGALTQAAAAAKPVKHKKK